MGRSNKKVKSERINALRKQYDSFLEEDKKRKERNEYILGKLDKMVYSTALVPVRQKAMTFINRPTPMYISEPEVAAVRAVNSSAFIKQQLTPDIPLQNIDDTYLIQEISKNYILIPKLRSPFINKYEPQAIPVRDTGIIPDTNHMNGIYAPKTSDVQPDDKENTDWKSKYEILNILKNEEKEKQTVQFADERIPASHLNKEIPLNDMLENIAISCNKDLATNVYPDRSKYDEVPEKDISDETVNLKPNLNAKTIAQADLIPRDNTDQVLAASFETVPKIDCTLEKTNAEYNYTDSNDVNTAGEVMNYAENADQYPEAHDTNPSGEVTNFTDHEEYNYIEPVNPKQTGDKTYYVEQYEPIQDLGTTEEQHYEPVNGLNVNTQDHSVNQLSDNVYVDHVENNENGYVEHVENDQNIYVEQESDSTYNPEGMTEQYALEHSENKVYQSHVNDPDNYVQENTNEQTFANTNADYAEYETESTIANDVTPTAGYQMKSATDTRPDGSTVEKTGIDVTDPSVNIANDMNIPPNVEPGVREGEVTEESANITGIEDFEAEQREMFYSELSNEQYGYQQGDTDVQGYPQHEEYQQNTDYYEGAVPQTYPVDVGENEQTLMYDPSYQEQYQNSIESAYRQEPPQEYEKQEGYEEMQPLDVIHQQSYENVDQVQMMLDTEEGYTEQTPDLQPSLNQT